MRLGVKNNRNRRNEVKSAKAVGRRQKDIANPQAVFRRFVRTLEKLQARAAQSVAQDNIEQDER